MPTPPTPPRTIDQRMNALAQANRVRMARAELKRDLKIGRMDVISVLLDPPAEVESMKAWDLLMAVPKIGRVKLSSLFRHAMISPAKTVGGLSERQRAELASWAGRWSSHPTTEGEPSPC